MSLLIRLSLGSDLGRSGVFVVGAAIVTAVYLVSAPLLMLVVTAFRGPGDLLPVSYTHLRLPTILLV